MKKAEIEMPRTLRNIALILGNGIGSYVVPFFVGSLLVAYGVRPFKEELNIWIYMLIFFSLAVAFSLILSYYFVPLMGKRILNSIEKEYGLRTRRHVYAAFAGAVAGKKFELDIPAIARTYGEGP